YRGFIPPPPGDHFSSELGLMDDYSDYAESNWIEYPREEIEKAIYAGVDRNYRSRLSEESEKAKRVFEEHDETIRTIVDALYADTKADALKRIQADLAKIERDLTAAKLINVMSPSGAMMTSDRVAMAQGGYTPVHIAVQAEQLERWHPFKALAALVACAKRTLKYMELHD